MGLQLNIHVASGFNAVNFFSYFTNLSNLLAATVLILGAVRSFGDRATTAGFDQLRFMSVVNMLIVGIVFSLLLRNADLGTLLPWVNVLLHYVMPCVVVVDWLLDPPSKPLWKFRSVARGSLSAAVSLVHAYSGQHHRMVSVPVSQPRKRGWVSWSRFVRSRNCTGLCGRWLVPHDRWKQAARGWHVRSHLE